MMEQSTHPNFSLKATSGKLNIFLWATNQWLFVDVAFKSPFNSSNETRMSCGDVTNSEDKSLKRDAGKPPKHLYEHTIEACETG